MKVSVSVVLLVVAHSLNPIDPMGQIQKRKGKKMMTTSASKSIEDVMMSLMKRMADDDNDERGVIGDEALDGTVCDHADR